MSYPVCWNIVRYQGWSFFEALDTYVALHKMGENEAIKRSVSLTYFFWLSEE